MIIEIDESWVNPTSSADVEVRTRDGIDRWLCRGDRDDLCSGVFSAEVPDMCPLSPP